MSTVVTTRDLYTAPETFDELYREYRKLVGSLAREFGLREVADVVGRVFVKLCEEYRRCRPCGRKWVVGVADGQGRGPGVWNYRESRRWPDDLCPRCEQELDEPTDVLREYSGDKMHVSRDGRVVKRTRFSRYLSAVVIPILKAEIPCAVDVLPEHRKPAVSLYAEEDRVLDIPDPGDDGFEMRQKFSTLVERLEERRSSDLARVFKAMWEYVQAEGSVPSMKHIGRELGLRDTAIRMAYAEIRLELRALGVGPAVL